MSVSLFSRLKNKQLHEHGNFRAGARLTTYIVVSNIVYSMLMSYQLVYYG
uniref:Uncharacterized protein n=1 Tax=Anguilla anguilla TaxID=7936 RepID=A0A0E9U4M2_ANGAN